jgi:hypothetical protein
MELRGFAAPHRYLSLGRGWRANARQVRGSRRNAGGNTATDSDLSAWWRRELRSRDSFDPAVDVFPENG